MAGRIVPVYRLTAGLTAARLRVADARGARPGRPRLSRVPAVGDPRRGAGPADDRRPRSRRPTTRPTFEARDAALRRLAFDELLALQLGMVGRRRARGRDTAPAIASDDDGRSSHPGGADRCRCRRRVGRPVELTDDQVAAMDQVRDDLAAPDPDAAAAPGRRRVGQDRGRRLRPGGRGAGRLPGRAPRPDRPARPPAPRHGRRAAGRPRGRRPPARRLAQGRRADPGARRRSPRARRRSSSGPTRCSRRPCRSPASAWRSSTSSIASASSSAASSRPRPAASRRTCC